MERIKDKGKGKRTSEKGEPGMIGEGDGARERE